MTNRFEVSVSRDAVAEPRGETLTLRYRDTATQGGTLCAGFTGPR